MLCSLNSEELDKISAAVKEKGSEIPRDAEVILVHADEYLVSLINRRWIWRKLW